VELEHPRAGQPIVETEVFGQVADAATGLGVADRLAEDARLAAGRPYQSDQDLDGRRLAGPVRTQKAEDLAWLDGQVEVVECDLATVRLVQVTGLDREGQWSDSAIFLMSLALSVPATP
jgi:hypothetical protein